MMVRRWWSRCDGVWVFTVEERDVHSGRVLSCQVGVPRYAWDQPGVTEVACVLAERDVWASMEDKGVRRVLGVTRRTYLKVSAETLAAPAFKDLLQPCYLFVQNIPDHSEPRVGCSRKGSVHVS